MHATGIKTRWVNSDRQLVDVLTKPTAFAASMIRLQQIGKRKIVWDADFTSAKNLRKEKRDQYFKNQKPGLSSGFANYVETVRTDKDPYMLDNEAYVFGTSYNNIQRNNL